jgi:hypothetical protein
VDYLMVSREEESRCEMDLLPKRENMGGRDIAHDDRVCLSFFLVFFCRVISINAPLRLACGD